MRVRKRGNDSPKVFFVIGLVNEKKRLLQDREFVTIFFTILIFSLLFTHSFSTIEALQTKVKSINGSRQKIYLFGNPEVCREHFRATINAVILFAGKLYSTRFYLGKSDM